MQKISRHKTRTCLFQALYSKLHLEDSFSKESFIESFFESDDSFIDKIYFDEAFDGIQENEGKLIYIINKFAPKFDILSMPIINIIPIFIAGYEMLYLKCDKIPEKVSINEALEMVKMYSDDQARVLVNGVLNSLKENKEKIIEELENIPNKNLFFKKYE